MFFRSLRSKGKNVKVLCSTAQGKNNNPLEVAMSDFFFFWNLKCFFSSRNHVPSSFLVYIFGIFSGSTPTAVKSMQTTTTFFHTWSKHILTTQTHQLCCNRINRRKEKKYFLNVEFIFGSGLKMVVTICKKIPSVYNCIKSFKICLVLKLNPHTPPPTTLFPPSHTQLFNILKWEKS